MIRLQVGAEEVKEFVEKESDKLRESAEKVRKMMMVEREKRDLDDLRFFLTDFSISLLRTKKNRSRPKRTRWPRGASRRRTRASTRRW